MPFYSDFLSPQNQAIAAALGPSIINVVISLAVVRIPIYARLARGQATISISFAILDESVLSFLGLGAQPPTPEWGSMISEAQPFLSSDPWMMFAPALAIILTVLSLNLVGDALRDRLDPRDVTRMAAPTQK